MEKNYRCASPNLRSAKTTEFISHNEDMGDMDGVYRFLSIVLHILKVFFYSLILLLLRRAVEMTRCLLLFCISSTFLYQSLNHQTRIAFLMLEKNYRCTMCNTSIDVSKRRPSSFTSFKSLNIISNLNLTSHREQCLRDFFWRVTQTSELHFPML